MNRKSYDFVNETIYIIEKTLGRKEFLKNQINIQVLAGMSFLSKNQYQRLFQSITGESVMDYIRKRRLDIARQELCETDISILDIALNLGYDSHEGFTRAFKSYFGVTPSRYRKHGKLNKTEGIKMLSNEVLNSICKDTEKISASISIFVKEAEKLSQTALKKAESAGTKGTGATIVAKELCHLAKRMEHIRDNHVKGLTIGSVSAFEILNRIFILIRNIDDSVFQMNLLRFFSGIEIGRISPLDNDFEAIDADYAKLCSRIVGEKEHMIKLLYEAVELLHTDIKQEASKCMESCIKVVNKAVNEGEATLALALSATELLGERGRAFSHIAKETSEAIRVLKSVSYDFNNTRDLSNAISQLCDTAFSMNINAFNSAIETAATGNTSECVAVNESILKYADTLHKTHQECEILCREYESLIELMNRNSKQNEQALAEKEIDDKIFQSKILSSNFSLEAERSNNNTFSVLAQNIVLEHSKLVKTRNIAEYSKAIEKFLQELNNAVDALEFGGSFAYLAKEYGYFLARLRSA